MDNGSNDTWDNWDASQRDLYILNTNGDLVFHENITSGIPSDLESMIINLLTDDVFQPQTKEQLQTAVDLWISDNTSALTTYGEINTWDVSLVTDMGELFLNKSTFNDEISSWDVSNVIEMDWMFHGASTFNQDLSSWDVSLVENMSHMFSSSAFNRDLSTWNVSSVTNMESMFASTPFNGNVSTWDVSSVVYMTSIFIGFNGGLLEKYYSGRHLTG